MYKIDRLTRSLSDFAKLVELFDAKSVSFVAVTQQFNTTSSMGRLTLNVLLSFAQFERELSSERVRDKIAASRAKGKWTGGSVPLGYDAHNKKLVINAKEAQTVRYIFKKYLELKSFSRLVADLDSRGIVTKRRNTKVEKFRGGIPFTYGPLANFLKNRIYLGQTHHKGKWFSGEHEAILDKRTFESVQLLLQSNSTERRANRSNSEAPLLGKLYDDRGNVMSPTFSTKKGVRYRYYISAGLLRGRKTETGSITRVSALAIESAIAQAIRDEKADGAGADDLLFRCLVKAVISTNSVQLRLRLTDRDQKLSIPWSNTKGVQIQITHIDDQKQPDQAILQSIGRAHHWMASLATGHINTVEDLGRNVGLHPKLVRNALRLACLAPNVVETMLEGRQPERFQVSKFAVNLPLCWKAQSKLLHGSAG